MSFYGATGFPTSEWDGPNAIVGGSSGTYAAYMSMFNTRRAVASPLTITFLSYSYSGDHASVKYKVHLDETLAEGNVCYTVLWEDKMSYGGREYRFVERKSDGYEVLTITAAGSEQIIRKEFTLNSGWNKANLGVTVLVQKFSNKMMYNAAATKLIEGNAIAPASLGRVKALFQ